jgi:hypothetical protein
MSNLPRAKERFTTLGFGVLPQLMLVSSLLVNTASGLQIVGISVCRDGLDIGDYRPGHAAHGIRGGPVPARSPERGNRRFYATGETH